MARYRRRGSPGDDAVRRAIAIFNEYGDFIRAVIRFQAHDRSWQEDLSQEFFLELIRRPVPADVRNPKSYLYRAIVHHILDSARARDNYRRAVKKYARNKRIPINNRSAGNALLQDTEERNATIASLTRYLQEREAQAFVLRYRDNFSIGEIARRMGVNARTVSRYLSESLRRLRETLSA
ncbi:MAG: sigma-70 family RNA polymerase sigma factor [Planctomycetes bacterium]|nr:sigma-70 family RNA polymerase sigma factor [Planctomycetota bacterium]